MALSGTLISVPSRLMVDASIDSTSSMPLR
jgi:hypothetical protein